MSMQNNPRSNQGALGGPGGVRGPSPMPGGGSPRAILMRGEKPRDFKGTMKKLIQYLGSYQLLILVTMIFAFASTIFSIFGPKLLGNATTELVTGLMAKIAGTGTIDFGSIGHIVLEVLFLYVLSSVFAYVQGWIMSGVSMDITYRFRKDIAEKINRMPLRYFDGTNHGEILSRITNDVDTVSQNSQPKPFPDHHLGDDGAGRADHDVHHQLGNDPGGVGNRPGIIWPYWPGGQRVPKIL